LQLTKRESEVGLGEMQASADRLTFVDFGTPTYFNEIGFATPLPKVFSSPVLPVSLNCHTE
jgi:hypothetical protein